MKRLNELEGFSGRLLQEADIPALMRLRREVLLSLADPDMYVPEDDEEGFLRQHCGPQGDTFGVFDGSRLVAYGALGLPQPDDPENLGLPLGLPADSLGLVAHMASCMVAPELRGLGLQRDLLKIRFEMARARGRRYAVAMVSLKNHDSRHNMLLEGMHVAWAGALMHGLRRQLLLKDLSDEDSGSVCGGKLEHRRVFALDFETQCSLCESGYAGIRDHCDEQGVWLDFCRRSD